MQVDWGILGIVLTVVFGIIGIFTYSRKNTIIIKTKNKYGNNNFSNAKIANKINNYKEKDKGQE